ncbi:MAG: DNA cytosine methyltransferase [Candidatus Latescibacteria bacterium]|nr:DNA cytosine methyltransferase [Candidatus Latescibacterota bacterium]
MDAKPLAISLFAGAGGCSLGFKRAGYNILYAIDINENAVETYRHNFPNTQCKMADIMSCDFEKLLKNLKLKTGDLDILIGGPPCQGFSTAGMRFWDDPRNGLLKHYVKALAILRPKWFIMENVEGLLTAKGGIYVYEAARAFIKLGYSIRIDKIYAQEYGIPQRRKRTFVIGNSLGMEFNLPEPIVPVYGRIFKNADVTLRHTIGELPNPTLDKSSSICYSGKPKHEWEEQLRDGNKKLYDHFTPKIEGVQLERIKHLKPGQSMKNLPEALHHESFKRRAYRRVMDGMPTERRGGAPSGIKRLIFDEPSLTITGAAIREFIHPEDNRPLTLRECARVQTFPDWFRFQGNTSEKIKQIGNAIPPLLAEIFAVHLLVNYGFGETKCTSSGRLFAHTLTKATAMSPALTKTDNMLQGLYKTKNPQLSLFG